MDVENAKFELGIKTGMNLYVTLFDVQNLNVQQEFQSGFNVNFVVTPGNVAGLAFQAEPGFVAKNSRIVIPSDSDFYVTFRFKYINIPVFLAYRSNLNYLSTNTLQQFYVLAGLEFNLLADAQEKVEKEGIDFANLFDIKDEVEGLEVSLTGALGTRFFLNQSSSISFEIRVIQGISSYNSSIQGFNDLSMTHFGIAFMTGISTYL